jgi:uncharacterized membrane protein YczE
MRMSASRTRYRLPALSPRSQLTSGRLARRLPQLVVGLLLYGWSMAMMLKADLGLAPWDVLHQGLTHLVPWSFGTVTIVVGVAVLLLWIPLRTWPGLGTVANVFLIGWSVDVGLELIPPLHGLAARIALLVGGVVANGFAGALYLGTVLGPGPRDGLMTGLVARTGGSVRLIRTGIELGVLLIGFVLGGTVGEGTVLYAVGIGPLVQLFLPWVAVRLPARITHEPLPTVADSRSGKLATEA